MEVDVRGETAELSLPGVQMRVDEPWHEDVVRRVDEQRVSSAGRDVLADAGDARADDEDVAADDGAVRLSSDDGRVLEQDSAPRIVLAPQKVVEDGRGPCRPGARSGSVVVA